MEMYSSDQTQPLMEESYEFLDEGSDSMKFDREKPKCKVSYEYLFWAVFLVWSFWVVLDRFYGNVLPPGCLSTGCLAKPLLPGNFPLTTRFFDVFNRATGRLFVSVTPALIFTQCKSTENWFIEHCPKWLYVGDLRTTNNRLHYMLGFFFLAVPMVVHMFTIFLPVMAGIPFQLVAGEQEHVLTPFVRENGDIYLTHPDFVRLPLAIITFLFLIPLSISNYCRTKSFSVAHWLHIAGAAIYAMDVMRGNHPHAQLFIAPAVIYYFVDRIVGIFYYRTGNAAIIHKMAVGDDYLVIFLYIPSKGKRKQPVGSVYYYGMPGKEGAGEFAHPFLSFQNHGHDSLLEAWKDRDMSSDVHKFSVDSDMGDASKKRMTRRQTKTMDQMKEEDLSMRSAVDEDSIITEENDDVVFFSNWNVGIVVQVHKENKTKSWTAKVADKSIGDRVWYWGPYTSEYSTLNPIMGLPPLTLIATGAGISYVLDFYMWMKAKDIVPTNPIQVYFSSNSIGLFQFVTDLLCQKSIENWHVSAHLTRHDDELEIDEEGSESRGSRRDMKLGRLTFADCIEGSAGDAEVYFCGAPELQWKVEVLCARRKLTFYPGHRFSAAASRDFVHIDGCRFKCRCTAFPFCFHY